MTRFPAAKILLTAVAVSASFSAFSAGQNTIPEELIAAAKKEGVVYSVGMPDTWANWKGTWADLEKLYGIRHQDTDMSSAQEIAKFAAFLFAQLVKPAAMWYTDADTICGERKNI